MLTLITSNSTDALADELASRQVEAGLHPLVSTTLIVPTLGHGRWLRQALAVRLGAAASLKATFPAQFIWQLTAAHLAHVPGVERAAPVPGEQLRWWVYEWLCHVAKAHSSGQSDANMPAAALALLGTLTQNETERYKLAHRLARLLGDYWVFRPEWLAAWQEGRAARYEPKNAHTEWQRALWRFVAQQTGIIGKRHPFQLLAEQLSQGATTGKLALPERVVLFGLTSLAPLYLQVFAELARYCSMELYSLSPSEAYWGDVLDKRALHKRSLPLSLVQLDVEAQEQVEEQDENPTLLAAWGKNARDFHAGLVSLTDASHVQDEPSFVDESESLTALAQLKREWLSLEQETQWSLPADDTSIQVHGCTTLQRQIEVLHDELAHLFVQDASLTPGDVLVLVPNIEQAAPLVHGVFGAHTDRYMPYSITGVPDRRTHTMAHALRDLLQLGQGRISPLSRFEAPAVLQLLRVEALATRMNFVPSEIDTLTQWVKQLEIHNGYGDEPVALALSRAHSWLAGLARLDAQIQALNDGEKSELIPPWLSATQAAFLAARLRHVLTSIAACRDQLSAPRSLLQWQATLHDLLDGFFASTEQKSLRWLLDTHELISSFSKHLPAAIRDLPLSAAVFSQLLADGLRTRAPGAVPTGSITFAQLGELRGLPYQHIVLLGIEQSSFAQSEAKLEFDLMAVAPRKGDRARASDELGALLDAVLAAQSSVSIYTQSRDAQTGEPMMLPIAINELLTLLHERTAHLKQAPQFRVEHALQPFNASSFNACKFSYLHEYNIDCENNNSENNVDTAIVYENDTEVQAPASLDAFARFLADPMSFQLKQRYKISLKDEADQLSSNEPASLQGLALWQLQKSLLNKESADEGLAASLPPGLIGELEFVEVKESVKLFMQAQQLTQVHFNDATEDISFEAPILATEATELVATSAAAVETNQVSPQVQAANCRAEFRALRLHDLAWLGLVQTQQAVNDKAAFEALCITKEQVLIMQPLPLVLAQSLLSTWQAAWNADQLQTPCLPEKTTWAWVEAHWKKGDEAAQLAAAHKAWQTERETPLWQCLLPDASEKELDGLSAWQPCVGAWFAPLLPYCKVMKLSDWVEEHETRGADV